MHFTDDMCFLKERTRCLHLTGQCSYHAHLGEIDQSLLGDVLGAFFDEGQIGEVQAKVGNTGWINSRWRKQIDLVGWVSIRVVREFTWLKYHEGFWICHRNERDFAVYLSPVCFASIYDPRLASDDRPNCWRMPPWFEEHHWNFSNIDKYPQQYLKY